MTNVLAVDPPAPPSERLLHVLIRGLNQESEEKAAEDKAMKKNADALEALKLKLDNKGPLQYTDDSVGQCLTDAQMAVREYLQSKKHCEAAMK